MNIKREHMVGDFVRMRIFDKAVGPIGRVVGFDKEWTLVDWLEGWNEGKLSNVPFRMLVIVPNLTDHPPEVASTIWGEIPIGV